GMLFDTLDTVVSLMRKASTTTGLRTTVNVIRRTYATGREAAKNFKTTVTLVFDDMLPRWNYVAMPQ
ncbi:MAG: ISAzo13 family transposase, partial [Planctomycetota bacterium]